MNVFRLTITLSLLVGFQYLAMAEFRPWTDVKGRTFEAEYVRADDDLVVLRLHDDTEVKVPFEALCPEDQNQAMLQSPPRINIKAGSKVVRDAVKARAETDVRIEAVTIDIALQKASTEPYTLELTLDLVLVGKMQQFDRFLVIDRTRSPFRFTNENNGLYEIACGPVDVRKVSGNANAGAEYEGYLIVVRDSRGE